MRTSSLQHKWETIRRHALPLAHHPVQGCHGYDRLLHAIGDVPVVLIGEASHGTLDFYRERAVITRRLIEEKDFTSVIVEADWPDAYRVNRFVQGLKSPNANNEKSAEDALGDFKRFPTWFSYESTACSCLACLKCCVVWCGSIPGCGVTQW